MALRIERTLIERPSKVGKVRVPKIEDVPPENTRQKEAHYRSVSSILPLPDLPIIMKFRRFLIIFFSK